MKLRYTDLNAKKLQKEDWKAKHDCVLKLETNKQAFVYSIDYFKQGVALLLQTMTIKYI